MSAGAAVGRLLVLVPWLLERPGASVAEAASAVGADEADVLRDLDVLQYCGLPGRLGGDLFEVELTGDRIVLRLAPVFERPVRPTPAEALELVLALDTVAAGLGSELPGLSDAVAALRRAAGVPAGAVVAPAPGDEWLSPLRHAVADRGTVRIDYRGRGTASERHVEPWELVLHGGHWYLHAHDRAVGALRTFRLDRVADVTADPATAAAARPTEALPLPAWEPGPDDVEIRLRVAPAGRWVLGLVTAVRVEEELPDGARVVVVPTDAADWLTDIVLAAAGHVVVLSPASMRATVARRARQALAHYDAT
jgi:proteasome accessory factor C